MRLADFILTHIEPILEEWEVFARGIWPDAAGATDPAALRDDAEGMLRATVADMKSDQTSAEQSDKSKGQGDDSAHQQNVDRVSSMHGSGRHGSGFNLPQVIAEYRALRGSVIRLWGESHPPPEPSDLTDLTRFNEVIDQSLTQAVFAFSKLVERERQASLDDQSRQAQRMREVNDALLVSSVRQHELAEKAERAERAVRKSEERFRNLADNMSQLAWTADAKGSIYWYNRRWFDYTGTTLEEMQGWGWKSVYHPEHLNRVVERIQRSWDTGEVWEDTFPLRGRDGSYRWFLSRARPIRNGDGEVVQWFGTNTDITEQRQMADELRQNAADMSEADRKKNEFLAMLAHELRNPLAPIRNAVEILRLSDPDDKVVRTASAMMDRQVGQMVRLVDDLLDVSRITRGKIEIRRSRVELAAVIHHAVEAARSLYKNLSHDLRLTLPTQPIYLNADPTRLAQIVGNLLNNACKFTDAGGRIQLTVELASVSRDAPAERSAGASRLREVLIRVQDSGIGIAPEQLPRIFEMFTQIDTSIERSISGLGIGLTLVKSLVEMHGGTVEAFSEGLGRGSEFVVRLPLASDEWRVASGDKAAADSDLATRHSPLVTPRRILVVDDNRDATTSLAELLEIGGHETQLAYDGVEAVAAAETFRPDLILLDIGLPKLNGYDVARAIRGQPWGRSVLLVALTGWGQDEDRRLSREAGFDAHLVKPVEYRDLVELMARGR